MCTGLAKVYLGLTVNFSFATDWMEPDKACRVALFLYMFVLFVCLSILFCLFVYSVLDRLFSPTIIFKIQK
jgi:hypothetical protein